MLTSCCLFLGAPFNPSYLKVRKATLQYLESAPFFPSCTKHLDQCKSTIKSLQDDSRPSWPPWPPWPNRPPNHHPMNLAGNNNLPVLLFSSLLIDCSLSLSLTRSWADGAISVKLLKIAKQSKAFLQRIEISNRHFCLNSNCETKASKGERTLNSFVAFCAKRLEFYLAANPVRLQGLVTACIGLSLLQNSHHLHHTTRKYKYKYRYRYRHKYRWRYRYRHIYKYKWIYK